MKNKVLEYIMRLRKTTKFKACFKENMSRIGRIYLPLPLMDKMNFGDELILQLAPDKSNFSSGGYITQLFYDKETRRKVRFVEGIEEKGELAVIYINRDILEHMGVEEAVAVRIISSEESGGVAIAQG